METEEKNSTPVPMARYGNVSGRAGFARAICGNSQGCGCEAKTSERDEQRRGFAARFWQSDL